MPESKQEPTPQLAAPQTLFGIRVIDLSRWVAGEFCTKFFADFGADVIKVEKPLEGSLTRRYGPFPHDEPDLDTTALFLHLNTNKRSVTLNLASTTGRDLFLRLVAKADLIVESFRPGSLERLGLGPAEVQLTNPRSVLTRISAFGQTGPYRTREATGLVMQGFGGPMNATGLADRPPHRKPGLLEHYTIGRMAAEASMAGLIAARRSGEGSVIDLAGVETLLMGADRRASFLVTAAYSNTNAPRGVRSAHRIGGTLNGAYPCKDGYVMLYITNQVFWNRLVELVGGDDEAFKARFFNRSAMQAQDDSNAMTDYVKAWILQRPKLELMELGKQHRVPLTAFLEVPEVMANEHLRSRDFFVRGEHPKAGSLEYLGPPWKMDNGWQLKRTAPTLGGDTHEVLSEIGIDPAMLPLFRGQGAI